MKIADVKDVLREADRWFEPRMENMPRFLLDNSITNYAYIIVRVDTGITKEDKDVKDCFKIYAVNLRTKQGWIRTRTVVKDQHWKDKLIQTCRMVWKNALYRARRECCPRIHINEWLKQQKQKI